MYLVLAEKIDERYSHNDIIIERTKFACNSAGFGGGGIALLYPELKIIDCNFTNNSASAGGGIIISNIISRKEIIFCS